MKTMKKVLSVILIAVMLLTAAPLSGFVGIDFPELDLASVFVPKAEAATEGYFTYTIEDGQATITEVDASISGNVIIPFSLGGYPVTGIGDFVFFYFDSITSVTIPDSVTSIGYGAFSDCSSLTSIAIPDSVTDIGDKAFSDCSSLTSINIPDSVTSIGHDAFWNCTSLASITIGDKVTFIGEYAFQNCTSLKSITIPDSVEDIGEYAFQNCTALTSATIGDKVTFIGEYAFQNCTSLKSITIPDSVEDIGSYAFQNCTALTSATIGDNVTSIEFWTFENCTELASVTIGDRVTFIGDFAFRNCESLKNITLPDGVTTIGEDSFQSCASLTSLTIPDGVTSIGYGAFSFCTSLKNITIGKNLKNLGYFAFTGCTALTSITADENNEYFSSDENGVLFDKYKTALKLYPTGNARTSYSIPDGVAVIEAYAFYNCTALTSITIPESVTSIGNYAFTNCTGLTEVYYVGNQEDWDNIDIQSGNTALLEATKIFIKAETDELTWDIDANGTLIISGTGPMRDYANIDRAPWYGQTSKIKRVVIEDGVTSIGDYAFFGCAGFTSIEIADSVTSIGNCAFYECRSLSGVSLPANLEAIGESAFFNCKRLTAISIPAKLTSIADDAFLDCKSIASFTVHEANTTYCSENGVLFNKDKSALVCYPAGKLDTQYSFPDGVFAILDSAFYNCEALESITLPDSLQSIGEFAFRNCTNLRSLHIPANVTNIGNGAFYNTVKMLVLTVDSENTAFTAADNALYNKNQSELLYYAAADGKISFTVPDSVIKIHDFAFSSATSLRGVTLGNMITYVGKSAFAKCTDLQNVYYSGTRAQWQLIDFESYNAPLLEAAIHFNSAPSATYKGLTAYIDDAYFASDSINYNHELARFCALFTVIGYNDDYQKPEDIETCLKACGFTVQEGSIVNNATKEQVNHFIAHKEIIVRGEWQTLIFAGFIGSYLMQWTSNFDPGTGDTHKGFANAKNYVYERLEEYIDRLGIEKDKTKILLTGHSRGAATCNLVARELIANGKYASPDSVYAYAFATPNSTSLPERKNAEYNRIFNVVNPEDLVTKLIPSAWGYGRYGITYTLPSEKNDYNHEKLLYEMLLVYQEIVKNDLYTPFPGGEEPTYKVMDTLTKVVKSIDEFYNKKFWWHYGERNDPGRLVSVQTFMTETLAAYQSYKDGSDEQKEAKKLIKDTALGGRISDDVLQALADYFVLYQGIGSFTNDMIGDDYFNEAHDAQTYCAFMFSLSERELQRSRKAYNGTVNCPVDVEIYDNTTGELVGRIVNNIVDEEIAAKDNAIAMRVDGDSKQFWLPSNGDYEVKLSGNDEGTMDYTLSEIDSDLGEVKRANFFDVEITDGFTMTADMSSEDFVMEEHELIFDDGTALEPTEILDAEDIISYTIEITTTEGGMAGSSRTANSGDYVSLTAVPEEGWVFAGWYEDDELISAEATLAFVAKSDRALTARFEQSAPSCLLGDVDLNGDVDSSDARLALRAAVKLETLDELQTKAADADKDGEISSSDARLILRAAVGLEILQ